MDTRTRETLVYMEELAGYMGDAEDASYQLVLIARDYADDEDLVRAREILAQVDSDYFKIGIQKHIANSPDFAHAVAFLIEMFGLDLSLTRGFGLLA